jgi:Family of unknown function (DUF6232)
LGLEAAVSTDSEQTLLDSHGCRLTNRRFVAPSGTTYLLSHVTSVRLEHQPREGGCAVLGLGIFGVLLFSAGGVAGMVAGGGIALTGLFYWFKQPTRYTLYLVTSAGEQAAMTSTERDFMQDLRDTLTDTLAGIENM